MNYLYVFRMIDLFLLYVAFQVINYSFRGKTFCGYKNLINENSILYLYNILFIIRTLNVPCAF